MSVSGSTSGSTGRGAPAGTRSSLRFVGVELNLNAHIWAGLTGVYGIGKQRALAICKAAGVDLTKKCRLITTEEEAAIRDEIARYTVEGELRRQVASNKLRLQKIRTYRGLRHFLGLPCRGQNTRNNAKTASRVK